MQNSAPRFAVIGGTGLNTWADLNIERYQTVTTPFGEPSAPLVHGTLHGARVVFLPRHGQGHKLPPHLINYRANLDALKQTGVSAVIGVAAVGAIADWFVPGEIALPDDLIDYTWGRAHSYSDGRPEAGVQHVEMTQPYHPELRARLIQAAAQAGVPFAGNGVMAVTQGPRLETAAEIRRLKRDGADMVGMTGMPEASLAAELGLQYASLAVSVNWGAGVKGLGDIHAEIEQSINKGMSQVCAVLAALAKL